MRKKRMRKITVFQYVKKKNRKKKKSNNTVFLGKHWEKARKRKCSKLDLHGISKCLTG